LNKSLYLRKIWKKWLLGLISLIVLIILAQRLNTVDWMNLVEMKSHPTKIILLIAGLFLFKALTLFIIPSVAVYLLSGLTLPTGVALLVVFIGICFEFVLNFYMGRRFKRCNLERLRIFLFRRYKLLWRLVNRPVKVTPLIVFLLRFLPGPPNNITSLFLGSSSMLFWPYIWSSILGALPKAVTVIIAGAAMMNPLSWQFLLPTGLFGIMVIAGMIIYGNLHVQQPDETVEMDELID